jgi:RNA-directed DNA polymerase
MPHFRVDTLRACVAALDGRKAPGVDGVSKDDYAQPLESTLQAVQQKVRQQAYRPQPVRRAEIPKADGSMRPLGSSCTEDKIVQEMVRRVREAIYEPVFLDPSYGFRPGRSAHGALRRLNQELMSQPVNWSADLDLAQVFDTMPHREIRAVLSTRSKDSKFLRLGARLLKAGSQTPGGVGYDEVGSPQGASVSPAMANAFLDTVLDQWVATGVKRQCRGYCEIMRDADASRAVFEVEEDAGRFMRVLPLRVGKFGLRLNHPKTQVLAWGNRQAWRTRKTKPRMPTCDFRGVTHFWGKRRQGRVRLKRKTAKRRFRRAVGALNYGLRTERNARPLPDLWRAIAGKLRGPFNYWGVTDNSPALTRFEPAVPRLVFKWLNRRSHRRSFSWERFCRSRARYSLPRPGRVVALNPVWGRAG